MPAASAGLPHRLHRAAWLPPRPEQECPAQGAVRLDKGNRRLSPAHGARLVKDHAKFAGRA